jgi:hypothetical protein
MKVGFWKAKMLRVTAFPLKSVPVGSRNLWNELQIGESERHEKTKISVSDQGPVNDNWFVVTNAGSRIDLLYLPTPSETPVSEFTDVGDFEESANWFLNVVSRWFENHCPPLSRLAFGAVLNHVVADRLEGYAAISDFLPFKVDAEKSRDFAYQINKPVHWVDSPIIEINRLSHWSVAMMATLVGDAILNFPQIATTLESQSSSFACEATFDINTAPKSGLVITREMAISLLRELQKQAVELSVTGDRE